MPDGCAVPFVSGRDAYVWGEWGSLECPPGPYVHTFEITDLQRCQTAMSAVGMGPLKSSDGEKAGICTKFPEDDRQSRQGWCVDSKRDKPPGGCLNLNGTVTSKEWAKNRRSGVYHGDIGKRPLCSANPTDSRSEDGCACLPCHLHALAILLAVLAGYRACVPGRLPVSAVCAYRPGYAS
jgi:hypothetical protein